MIDKIVNNTRILISGEGYPIVFLHGFTTTAEFWKYQTGFFSKDYQVIRVELSGHGKNIASEDAVFTIDRYAEDVISVVDHLNLDQFILVGLSMGGSIAQSVTLRIPERVKGLGLIGATAHGLGDAVVAENVLGAISAEGIEKASQDVIEASFASTTDLSLIKWAKGEVVQTPEFVARQAIVSLNETDHTLRLGTISSPTLIVVGSHDKITPVEESEKLADLIPNSRLEILNHAAHFPMLEQPETFNNVLMEFIQSIN